MGPIVPKTHHVTLEVMAEGGGRGQNRGQRPAVGLLFLCGGGGPGLVRPEWYQAETTGLIQSASYLQLLDWCGSNNGGLVWAASTSLNFTSGDVCPPHTHTHTHLKELNNHSLTSWLVPKHQISPQTKRV